MEYTGRGQGTYNTVAGSIGLASAVLGNGLFNLGGNYVSRETFDLQTKVTALESANALLNADLNSEKKMVEVFNAASDKINNVRDELSLAIRELDKKVDANAAAQAVINCGFQSANAVLSTQVAQLMEMTKLVIPIDNISPKPAEA